MKKTIYKSLGALLLLLSLGACNKFEEINKDPNAVDVETVEIEYLLNRSIFNAQQNPSIAERIFVLTWGAVGRATTEGGIDCKSNDGWLNEYWNGNINSWANDVSQAVRIGNERIADGSGKTTTSNFVQLSRIWRAYLCTEQADLFGIAPDPNTAYNNVLPDYVGVKEIYKFVLTELTDAVAKIDKDVTFSDAEKKQDLFYKGDLEKWIKYANSLRMRCAMRLSNLDPAYAQAQFEAAANHPGGFISTTGEVAQVEEGGGWDSSTAVMSRSWNTMMVAMTYSNLALNLGGVSTLATTDIKDSATKGLTPAIMSTYGKDPATYLGLKLPADASSSKTNIMTAPYAFNYIPTKIDPRATIVFSIPGLDVDGVNHYPMYLKKEDNQSNAAYAYMMRQRDSTFVLKNPGTIAGSPDTLRFRVKYSWMALPSGEWGDAGKNNRMRSQNHWEPTITNQYRKNSDHYRIWFGPWESYLLLAEAALKGWAVPGTDASNYEAGVKASFDYYGLGGLADQYLASTDYNRVGTSASYSHTSEASPATMDYEDLSSATLAKTTFSGKPSLFSVVNAPTNTVTYNYPKGRYATNNDALTKILTQKFLSQTPYLSCEVWSDYRRLNLPFFENPVLEKAMVNMPWYTDYTAFDARNVMGRAKLPSDFSLNNQAGYNQAVSTLNGPDTEVTPLLWAANAK